MTHKEQFTAMLDAAKIRWHCSNLGADIVVASSVFRFTPNGELDHAFGDQQDEW